MKQLRINAPGDGEWIMERIGGRFSPERDHVIATYDDSGIRGGFVFTGFLVGSITVHMAGDDVRWCSRDLLWMTFDYAFNQIGVRMVIALVEGTNYRAIAEDLRAGFRLTTVVPDACLTGDLAVLTMTRESCPWLNVRPRGYVSNVRSAA